MIYILEAINDVLESTNNSSGVGDAWGYPNGCGDGCGRATGAGDKYGHGKAYNSFTCTDGNGFGFGNGMGIGYGKGTKFGNLTKAF